MYILILILIIIILCLVFSQQQPQQSVTVQPLAENFDHSISTKGSKFESTLRRPYRGVYNSRFNGKMAIDDQYYFDALYDDVIYYSNQHSEHNNLNDVVETGMEKCYRECPGYCVEYGVTSNGYCFNY